MPRPWRVISLMGNRRASLLILGSGTSYGVPMIGCDCAVCRSPDPRNKRTRASALVRIEDTSFLIDTSTDLRAQALRHGIREVDAVLYTHSHADHLHGIDDLRSFSARRRRPVPAYGDARTMSFIRQHYGYIFSDVRFELGWGIPRIELHVIEGPTLICGVEVIPVPLVHGGRPVLGYRIGSMAYLTDCNGIPPSSWPLLDGLEVLVIDGLRPRPQPTHFCISEALDVVARLHPRRAWITHLTHDVEHAAVEATLPDGVRLAYDGLEVEFDPGPTEERNATVHRQGVERC